MDIKEIISVVVAIIVGIVWGVLELRRWRKEKHAKDIEEANDLRPNPVRCADHEGRLRKVEEVCVQYKIGHDDLIRRVDDIGTDVKTLISMHLKG